MNILLPFPSWPHPLAALELVPRPLCPLWNKQPCVHTREQRTQKQFPSRQRVHRPPHPPRQQNALLGLTKVPRGGPLRTRVRLGPAPGRRGCEQRTGSSRHPMLLRNRLRVDVAAALLGGGTGLSQRLCGDHWALRTVPAGWACPAPCLFEAKATRPPKEGSSLSNLSVGC